VTASSQWLAPRTRSKTALLQEDARFVVAAQVGQDRGQCCAVGGGVGVVGPESGIADLDGASGCCLSVGGASGGVGEAADVVEHGGELGIVGFEACGQHGAGGRIQLRGLVEAAGVLQQHGHVVADPGRGQIVGGQVALGDGQRPPVELFGGGGVAGAATAACRRCSATTRRACLISILALAFGW
jgi:hypothetical protein